VTQSRTEAIRAVPGSEADGGEFSGHLVLPDSGSGPGLLVVQEIFGLSPYIEAVCERVAQMGYVALAPDLFWRLEPGVAIDEQDPDALQRGLGYRQRLDFEKAVEDAVAALGHLRNLPEVAGGRAGVMGFCLGGGISYRVAAAADPDCAVSYYGSDIPPSVGLAGEISCPILFHFGLADQFLTLDGQEVIRSAFSGRPEAEFHEHPGANHAFDNFNSPMFHHAEASARAWEQTQAFLRAKLPV
jgi:carboxymethylenebutenolidase